jgi:hypothetical protein
MEREREKDKNKENKGKNQKRMSCPNKVNCVVEEAFFEETFLKKKYVCGEGCMTLLCKVHEHMSHPGLDYCSTLRLSCISPMQRIA